MDMIPFGLPSGWQVFGGYFLFVFFLIVPYEDNFLISDFLLLWFCVNPDMYTW